MDKEFKIKPIGVVEATNGFKIKVNKECLPALKNISGFSHLQILWWGNLSDSDEERNILIVEKPYKKSPEEIGTFATRSQMRPNPILTTIVMALDIDFENGVIHTPYIDAENGTPVLDIKPYHFNERVKECSVPDWCSHWPKWYEESSSFNWGSEFNFKQKN